MADISDRKQKITIVIVEAQQPSRRLRLQAALSELRDAAVYTDTQLVFVTATGARLE